jgi:hypothetical protein
MHLRLCWIDEEFCFITNRTGSSLLPMPPAEPWQKNLLAVFGFCIVHEVGLRRITEWSGIEEVRDMLVSRGRLRTAP